MQFLKIKFGEILIEEHHIALACLPLAVNKKKTKIINFFFYVSLVRVSLKINDKSNVSSIATFPAHNCIGIFISCLITHHQLDCRRTSFCVPPFDDGRVHFLNT